MRRADMICSVFGIIFGILIIVGVIGTSILKDSEGADKAQAVEVMYSNSDELNYAPIGYQNITDGGTKIAVAEFVDLDTGVIYVKVSQFKQGYDISWSPKYNAEGLPVIYEDLEILRKAYDYGVK